MDRRSAGKVMQVAARSFPVPAPSAYYSLASPLSTESGLAKARASICQLPGTKACGRSGASPGPRGPQPPLGAPQAPGGVRPDLLRFPGRSALCFRMLPRACAAGFRPCTRLGSGGMTGARSARPLPVPPPAHHSGEFVDALCTLCTRA